MAANVWLGARRIAIKADGVQFDYSTDRVTAQVTYAGPHEMLLAQRPSNGASVNGFGNLKVDRSVIRKANAPGMGEMDVFLSDDSDDDTEASGKPITEIFWLESEIDLLRHPRYNTGGAKPLTNTDLGQIELWKQQTNPDNRTNYVWQEKDSLGNVLHYGNLSTNAQDYGFKWLRGQDSYLHYTPVAVLVTFSRAKPSAVRLCGRRISGKPFAACPDGFVWLRVADRHTRSGRHGKWQRTQQYTGAVSWDTDLYEAAT